MADIISKLCMCGDHAVGKTSLVRRFVKGVYDEQYKSTVGSVVYKKNVFIEKKYTHVKMMIWDIAGQAEYKRVHRSAFKKASGALVVCDLTRDETLNNVSDWIDNLFEEAGEIPVIILANKYDLVKDDKESISRAEEILEGYDFPYSFTSAKTGKDVESTFKDIGGKISESIKDGIPSRIEPEEVEMPKKFDDPNELMDYLMGRFCYSLGDEEMGMHILRKQIDDEGINFENISRPQLENLSQRLVMVIKDNVGPEESRELKRDLVKACNRWNRW